MSHPTPATTARFAPSMVPDGPHARFAPRMFHAADDGGGGAGGGTGAAPPAAGGQGGGMSVGGVTLPPDVFNNLIKNQGWMQPPAGAGGAGGDAGSDKGGDKGKGGDGGTKAQEKPPEAAAGGTGDAAGDVSKSPQYLAVSTERDHYKQALGGVLDQLEKGLPAQLQTLVKQQSTTGEGDDAVVDQLARARAINMAFAMQAAKGGGVDTGRSGTDGTPGTRPNNQNANGGGQGGLTSLGATKSYIKNRLQQMQGDGAE